MSTHLDVIIKYHAMRGFSEREFVLENIIDIELMKELDRYSLEPYRDEVKDVFFDAFNLVCPTTCSIRLSDETWEEAEEDDSDEDCEEEDAPF